MSCSVSELKDVNTNCQNINRREDKFFGRHYYKDGIFHGYVIDNSFKFISVWNVCKNKYINGTISIFQKTY